MGERSVSDDAVQRKIAFLEQVLANQRTTLWLQIGWRGLPSTAVSF